MKEIIAYQCFDGSIYSDEDKARAHDEDCLGQELDGLLRLFELDIARNHEHRGLLAAMKKRKELHQAAKLIVGILEFSGE